MIFTNQYNPVLHTNGEDLTEVNQNAPLNPINSWIDVIKNFESDSFTTSTANDPYTINPNNQILLYVDSTGGDAVINLPAGALQTNSSITIKKIDKSGNKVLVTTDGTDKIEKAFVYETVPSSSVYELVCPDDFVEIFPDPDNTNIWRVVNNRVNLEYFTSASYNSGGITGMAANTAVTIPYDTVVQDKSGSFNVANYTYTCPADGVINAKCMAGNFSSTTARRVDLFIQKNGSNVKYNQFPINSGDISATLVGRIGVAKGDTIRCQMRVTVTGTNLRQSVSGQLSEFVIDYISLL